MQIVLQHEANGLFLGEEREWVETSRDARKFSNGDIGLLHVADAERDGGRVSDPVGKRDSHRVAANKRDTLRFSCVANLAKSQREHRARKVDPENSRSRTVRVPLCTATGFEGDIGRARADVNQRFAAGQLQ